MSGKQAPSATPIKKSTTKPPLLSGSKLALKAAGARALSTVALLSKIWAPSEVGIYVDIPVSGTPQARMLIGRYGVHAIEKATMKVYRTADYGVFNPRMGKDGVDAIEARHDIASDGAPTNVRLQLTAKPHRVGQVLAAILAKAQFVPPTSDLSTPLLAGFPKDVSGLHWAAQKFYDALNNHATIALIGGKKSSIKANVGEKFASKFAKAYRKPEFRKTSPPSDKIELTPEMHAFDLKLTSGGPAAPIVVAHALSNHGTVWQDGNRVSLTVDPEYAAYARKMAITVLSNVNRSSSVLAWYAKQAERDPINGNSVATMVAIAGIASGLPISGMTELLSMKTLPIPSTAKGVNNAAEALKATKAPAKTVAKTPETSKTGKKSGKKGFECDEPEYD